LTLCTTPVVYLFFDRIARRYRKAQKDVELHAMSAD